MKICSVALALLILLGCGTATVNQFPDSGATGTGGSAAAPPDGGAGGSNLPAVTPSGKKCPANLPDTQVCVEEGWFVLSRWTTGWRHEGPMPYDAEPTQAVYLDAFVLDQHEVTNDEYQGYVKAAGAAPPPAKCGRKMLQPEGDDLINVDEVSGWDPVWGAPYRQRPVVCVTREDAIGYCAFKKGRLPTVAEWFKAGRGPYPDDRRFAWGEKPSQDPNNVMWAFGYAHLIGSVLDHNLDTQDVKLDGLGKSPWGALGLAGNATEIVGTCAELLAATYPSDATLIRPKEPATSKSCTGGVLLAGSNWMSGGAAACAGQSILVRGDDPKPHYPGVPGGEAALDAESCFSFSEFAKPETDGNAYRSWFVGFRCAYDVP